MTDLRVKIRLEFVMVAVAALLFAQSRVGKCQEQPAY